MHATATSASDTPPGRTIIATGQVDPLVGERLAPFGRLVVAADHTEAALLPLLPGAVGLVVRGEGAAGAGVIEAAVDLRVIGRSGVGYDNVDIAAATGRRIPVIYTPGAGARAVAEAAMAFMLALCKHLGHWDRQLKTGQWHTRNDLRNGDLDGATLGIVGLGRIGRVLAALVAPFNMTVLACDPFIEPAAAAEVGARLVDLEELMAGSDFISLHTSANEQNRGMINRAVLGGVKRGAYLVNLARGSLIESLDVLQEALADGRLAGVALDVFDPEPPDVGHAIFGLPQCLTAPHAVGMTDGAMARIFQSMADDMAAVLSGGRPRFVVNPEVFD